MTQPIAPHTQWAAALLARSVRVLQSREEIDQSYALSSSLRLCPNPDYSKHWDNYLAVELLLQALGKDAPIADLGCRSGIILTWLHQLGFKKLNGCDMRMPLPPLKAALMNRQWNTFAACTRQLLATRGHLTRARVEETGFPGESFAAVTCMSVIEHGVDLPAFFAEAERILRPGGLLVVSTDYWPEKIDTGALRRYKDAHNDDRVFDRGELMEIIDIARSHCLRPVAQFTGSDLDSQERAVGSLGYEYTFALLAFRKDA